MNNMTQQEFTDLLEKIKTLPERYRLILSYKIHGYSHSDIAQLMNMSTRTVSRDLKDIADML
jgi:DNA-directed RNA polymerase specialized sigma24 family protein